ncbi:hypothetical protein [Neobacillus sp. D3-1R]|uniref:hypothetical protein n=1 Tax=Neobacillus sp. D3-1R TaxID=3445778 RepID=UPI003F9F3743
MTIFSDCGYYEMDFQNMHFRHLQFVRMDKICEVLYVTMKNVLTGELLTFEHNEINWIRKMALTSELVPLHIVGIAQTQEHSLY